MRVPPKTKFSVIADSVRPSLANASIAEDLAGAIVAALMKEGWDIIRNGRARLEGAERGPPRRPVLTNAIAGDGQRRGVFAAE